jgi:gas vesicle protein
MQIFIGFVLGVLIGFTSVLLVRPTLVAEPRLQAKIEALEWLVIDHEKEINALKKARN